MVHFWTFQMRGFECIINYNFLIFLVRTKLKLYILKKIPIITSMSIFFYYLCMQIVYTSKNSNRLIKLANYDTNYD